MTTLQSDPILSAALACLLYDASLRMQGTESVSPVVQEAVFQAFTALGLRPGATPTEIQAAIREDAARPAGPRPLPPFGGSWDY